MGVEGRVAEKGGKMGVETGDFGFLPMKQVPGFLKIGDAVSVSEDQLDIDSVTLKKIHLNLAVRDGRITPEEAEKALAATEAAAKKDAPAKQEAAN